MEPTNAIATGATTLPRRLVLKERQAIQLPLFIPVYQPQSAIVPTETWPQYGIEGCIVNGFFLYKRREIRARFEAGEDIHDYIGFHGLVMTDSGAFQGFSRQLYLKNSVIVRFQELTGADIVSPLDLISPPGDNHSVAEGKLRVTLDRIREARALVSRATLAGVQQGGRFLDLRRRSVEELMSIGIDYLAIGSLVPFFNRNSNLEFVGHVLRDARRIVGPDMPMHVYGAGDPLELPFLVALGADIFDSSSYGHYAHGKWYMTRFGALKESGRLKAGEYVCQCHVCQSGLGPDEIFASEPHLAAHNLWTILDTIHRVREAMAQDRLEAFLKESLETNAAWFPDSSLNSSWEALHT